MKPEAILMLQTFDNIRRVTGHYGLPNLIVSEPKEDRCFFYSTVDFMLDLANLVAEGKFARWDWVWNHGGRRGWRETVCQCSLQIIDHGGKVECDFDLWNPERGLAPMFMHGLECAWNWVAKAKTNPFAVRKVLEGRAKE